MSVLTAILLVACVAALVAILVHQLIASDERRDARRRNDPMAHPLQYNDLPAIFDRWLRRHDD